jgi:2-polyprenyl-6-methoxyphenol hydroxylase-like FAD-dependent oxidoreductase
MTTSETQSNGRPRQAVVLGAGISGLVAARVLANHFDRVIVVEPDRLPTDPSPRTGTPQCRHVHILLSSGRDILERLFPGFLSDLAEGGAPLLDGIYDVLWLNPFGWGIRYRSKHWARSASRPLYEFAIRRRLTQNPRVTFVEERAGVGLLASGDGSQVHGVRIRRRERGGEPGGAEEELSADLVVDASGRGSHATQWLRDLGYPAPPTTELNAFFGYSTRLYRLRPDPARDWQGLYVQVAPPADLRGSLFLRLENDQWIATLGGSGKDYPPTDEAGFLEFARSLRSPLIYDAIKDAEPLTDISSTRSMTNLWRHYDKLPRWPDGFIVLGDAACAFNPVYGQGMSVAAKEAMLLDACLRRPRPAGDLTGLAGRFQKELPRTIRPVWTLASGSDLRVPGVEGGLPGRSDRFVNWYIDRVIALATEDILAREFFTEVLNLNRPATSLFDPRLVVRVLRGPRRRPTTGGDPRVPTAVAG